MARIEKIELSMVDLVPKVRRTDAIQSFVSQETPIVKITDSDGAVGTGYSYTIGTGGSSVMRLLRDHLAPRVIGRDGDRIEAIWHELEFATHATTIGAITAIALAAIDTALWDLRARKMGLPLWKLAGGARDRCPLYTTEGGWLHIETAALVDDALEAKQKGFGGSKVKIGKPHGSEDFARLEAIRKAVGDSYEIMTDANQGFRLDEAIRRSERLKDIDLAWIEEPLPADDIDGHVRLSASTSTPIAIGESLYSIRHFREYMQKGACSIVQVDVGRIGGITPWLKVAHAAEAFDIPVCPHFLMELHVSLACAVPNGKYVEYIPQLDEITGRRMAIENGHALAPSEPGLGIDWDWDEVRRRTIDEFDATIVAGELTMQRMGFVIGLQADKVAEYKRLHAAVWPEILAMISACNIRNYSIYLREPENLLFATYEYHGTDHDADMARMAADPRTQAWWAVCMPCQKPLESRKGGEWWAAMEEVFHLD